MFDLNQLQCFLAVAEELHFGRAAARLHMTQPPLSRQIQILERILDVKLLERTSREVRLTPAGRSFLPEARRLLKMAESASYLAKRVDSGRTGAVRIAFTASSSYSFLPALITDVTSSLPDIDFILTEMVTREQVEALLAERADIGLMRPPITHPGLDCRSVLKENLLAAIPLDHPLARRKFVLIKDFENQPFVMYAAKDARYFHDIIVSLFWEEQVRPHFVQHLTQIHSIMALVQAGLGCALVPESAKTLQWEGVALLPLKPGKPDLIELLMVWRRDEQSPLIRRVLKALRG